MARQWYYQVKGMEAGPVSSAELRTMARQGLLSADAQVRNGATARWVSAAKIQGLYELMPAANQPSAEAAVATAQSWPDVAPPIAPSAPEPDYVGEEIVEEIANAKKLCPECAAVLPDNAALCVDCGFDLRTGKKIVAEVVVEGEPKTSSRVSHLLMGVGGSAIGAGLLCLLIVVFSPRGDRAAKAARDTRAAASSSLTTAIGGRSDHTPQSPIVFVDLPPVAAVVPTPPPAAAVLSAPETMQAAPPVDDPQLSAAWQRDWMAFGEALNQTYNQQQFVGKEVHWRGTFDRIVEKTGGKKAIHLKMPHLEVSPVKSYRFTFDDVELVPVEEEMGEWANVPAGKTVTFRTTINERNADSAENDVNGIRVIKVTFIGSGARLVAAK